MGGRNPPAPAPDAPGDLEGRHRDLLATDGHGPRSVLVRVIVGLLVAVLIALAVIALTIQDSITDETETSNTDLRVASVYQDARFWVGQEESLERKYRLEPGPEILRLHNEAEAKLTLDLERLSAIEPTAAVRRQTSALLRKNGEYASATRGMFAAVRAGNKPLVVYYDHIRTDPVFSAIEDTVYGNAAAASRSALSRSAQLGRDEAKASRTGVGALAIALTLLGIFALILRRARRVQRRERAEHLEWLRQLAISDPLTGLRNHRAFQEDLAVELDRSGRSGAPLSLVMLDADGLKQLNDTCGHQSGDAALIQLGHAMLAGPRAGDRAYRVGGDEFAMILHDTRAWGAFEFVQRLQRALAEDPGAPLNMTAGISEALAPRPRDELIHEADVALMNAKRSDRRAVIFTPEMEPFDNHLPDDEVEHHTQTLARALALAVDSKDSYTRSHSQTVATLCAVLGAELGVDHVRLPRLRLAGLLHDVGKIGIPDSILKKPARLSADEFEQMKTHSALGEGIVLAAEMPVEARWVRHHHERVDGRGYPDGLAGEHIPFESRIIHVADAFEAMTSDRPYREAPGVAFALEELARHAGTQFDARVVDALVRLLAASEERSTPVWEPDDEANALAVHRLPARAGVAV
ncbi:MAG TPA: diguanylate cyclase [Solirubrobacteraceae bacterium]|nr:diguanylate cyclase [Solirubrobacteraceae bacterium]